MGDEGGMDPCECIWGHEMAMRRLLSLLRQSQAYCTDNECFDDIVGARNQTQDTNGILLSLLFVFALLLYYLRPRFNRHSNLDGPEKPQNNGDGFSGNPPSPPTAS